MKKILAIISLLIIGSTTLLPAQTENATYNFTAGYNAYTEDDIVNARKFLLKEVEENKSNGVAHLILANIYLTEETNIEEGLKHLKQAEKYVSKKDSILQANLQALYGHYYVYNKEEYEKALDHLSKSLEYNPQDNTIYLLRIYCNYELGHEERVEADIKKLVELNPYSAEYHDYLANWYAENGDYATALEYYKYAIAMDEDYAEPQYGIVECNIMLHNYVDAINQISYLLNNNDYNSDISHLITLLSKSDSKLTEIFLRDYMSLLAESPNYTLALATHYTTQREYEKAIEQYKLYMRDNISNETIYYIAYCYSLMGDDETALEYINHYQLLEPDDISQLDLKCATLCHLGRFDEALEILDSAIESSEDENYDEFCYTIRYRTNLFKRDYAAAVSDLTRVLEYNEDAGTVALRGHIYTLMGEKEAAARDFKQAEKLYKNNRNSTEIMMCYAYIHTGNNKKALAVIEKVLADTNDTDYYNISCIYSLMNDSEKAIKYLEQAIKLEGIDKSSILLDPDMDNIRELEKFKELMEKYY